MLTPYNQLSRVATLVSTLQGAKFFGQVQIDMQNGHIVLVRLSQSLKPEDMRDGKETFEDPNS